MKHIFISLIGNGPALFLGVLLCISCTHQSELKEEIALMEDSQSLASAEEGVSEEVVQVESGGGFPPEAIESSEPSEAEASIENSSEVASKEGEAEAEPNVNKKAELSSSIVGPEPASDTMVSSTDRTITQALPMESPALAFNDLAKGLTETTPPSGRSWKPTKVIPPRLDLPKLAPSASAESKTKPSDNTGTQGVTPIPSGQSPPPTSSTGSTTSRVPLLDGRTEDEVTSYREPAAEPQGSEEILPNEGSTQSQGNQPKDRVTMASLEVAQFVRQNGVAITVGGAVAGILAIWFVGVWMRRRRLSHDLPPEL